MEDFNSVFTSSEIISKIKSTIDQEISVIENNDWTSKSTIGEKSSYYSIEYLIIENIVKVILDIHTSVAGRGRERAQTAYKWIDKLMNVYKIFSKRANMFLAREGKMTSELKEDDIKHFRAVLDFRKTVRDDLSKFEKMLKIIVSEDSEIKELPFTLRKNTIVPLSMRVVMEDRFPEIKDYVKNRHKRDEEII